MEINECDCPLDARRESWNSCWKFQKRRSGSFFQIPKQRKFIVRVFRGEKSAAASGARRTDLSRWAVSILRSDSLEQDRDEIIQKAGDLDGGLLHVIRVLDFWMFRLLRVKS